MVLAVTLLRNLGHSEQYWLLTYFTVAEPPAWNSQPWEQSACHYWNNPKSFRKLIYLKFHLHIKTVSNCKALSKQLILPTAYLNYITFTLLTYWTVVDRRSNRHILKLHLANIYSLLNTVFNISLYPKKLDIVTS